MNLIYRNILIAALITTCYHSLAISTIITNNTNKDILLSGHKFNPQCKVESLKSCTLDLPQCPIQANSQALCELDQAGSYIAQYPKSPEENASMKYLFTLDSKHLKVNLNNKDEFNPDAATWYLDALINIVADGATGSVANSFSQQIPYFMSGICTLNPQEYYQDELGNWYLMWPIVSCNFGSNFITKLSLIINPANRL